MNPKIHITDEVKAQIKELNKIEDVIAEYGIQLRPESNALIGNCPFHDDSTPSFYVYPETQSCYCYGCGAGTKGDPLKLADGTIITDAGSDVIAFVQHIENISYPEACIKLMTRAGIPLPAVVLDPEAEKIKKAQTDRNRRYYYELKQTPAALEFLYKRHITDESIDKFRLGLVPLTEGKEDLRGRIAVGIMEVGSDKPATVAMAYRATKDEKPKWRNDGTNKCFSKKATLYLLSHAWKTIRKWRFAVVVEGYFDAIIAHQAGLTNTVATMGAGMTPEQVALLRRYTDTVYLWLDGDGAGKTGTMKSLPLLLQQGFKVMLVEPREEDPDEIIIHQCAQDLTEVREYLRDNSRPAIQVIVDDAIRSFEDATEKPRGYIDQQKARALEKVLPILNACQPAEQAVYQATVMRRLGL